ncbi:MAG TPA: hypothetical protein VE619_10010 [Nitrososphaeraceae archaeon]|nr:hypothetical protein [Nitrososphaeraceae archaeon]
MTCLYLSTYISTNHWKGTISILGKSRSLKRIGVLVSEGERLVNLVDVES